MAARTTTAASRRTPSDRSGDAVADDLVAVVGATVAFTLATDTALALTVASRESVLADGEVV